MSWYLKASKLLADCCFKIPLQSNIAPYSPHLHTPLSIMIKKKISAAIRGNTRYYGNKNTVEEVEKEPREYHVPEAKGGEFQEG